MNVIKCIISIVSVILLLLFGMLTNIINICCNFKDEKKSKKYYGSHDSEYSSIDDATYHYAVDRMNDMVYKKDQKCGRYEYDKINSIHKKNKIKTKKSKTKKKLPNIVTPRIMEISNNKDDVITDHDKYIMSSLNKKKVHNWYSFNNWCSLRNNVNEYELYLIDRKKARYLFLFNWQKVLDKIHPFVHNEKYEAIGVIRAEPDGTTLYIHSLEKSPVTGNTDTYAAGISNQLVRKYSNIPGYFLFHTHPLCLQCDPLPSDADIYCCLLDCYDNKFVGHAVIGEYGIIVYFIKTNRINELREGGELKFFTYCYDLLNAWNAFNNSANSHNQKDRIEFLGKWGFDMIVIPSSEYISHTYDKKITPPVIHDRFIKTKYELTSKIKEIIKKIETMEDKLIKKKIVNKSHYIK